MLGGPVGMDTQPTHALELEHGEQKLGRIAQAARARLDWLQPDLLELGGLELGGRRGTAETRHFLRSVHDDVRSHLGVAVPPGRGEHLPYSPRPVNPGEYV